MHADGSSGTAGEGLGSHGEGADASQPGADERARVQAVPAHAQQLAGGFKNFLQNFGDLSQFW